MRNAWIMREEYGNGVRLENGFLMRLKIRLKKITISVDGGKDRYIWSKVRNGVYSAKSGYHVIKANSKKIDRVGPSSSGQIDKRIWGKIWKLEISDKHKNFLWRLCTNSIAIKANLWKKKLYISPYVQFVGWRLKLYNIYV